MRKTILFTAFVPLLALSCSSPSQAAPEASSPPSGAFSWRKALVAQTPLTVTNVNGGIRTEAASGDTLEIIATKSGRTQDLPRVRVIVEDRADGIVACALWPGQSSCGDTMKDGNDVDVRVELVLRVPAKVSKLGAKTLNGSIRVPSFGGDTHLRTLQGNIDVTAGGAIDAETLNGTVHARAARKGSPVHVSTKNGNIELSLPNDADADVRASTLRGKVEGDVGDATSSAFPIGSAARFRLGAGGVAVDAQTLNGNILVRRVL